jgi:hypothetical protein
LSCSALNEYCWWIIVSNLSIMLLYGVSQFQCG